MAHYTERVHHLKGSARDIGYEMGRILGDRLEHNITRYIAEFGKADAKFSIDWEKLEHGALAWFQTLPERFQEEFSGMAAGAGLPLQRIAQWFFIEQCAVQRCSSTVSMVNGHAWVARNNDTVAPGTWGYVTIREVTDRIPTIIFGREGDVFDPTGINQERLWLHYNALPVVDVLNEQEPHVPPFVFMTDALETCGSIQDVESLLKRTQRTDGMLLFAVDGKTDEFAIFECGHRMYYRRDAIGPWIAGTNHYCMCQDPDPPSEDQPLNTFRRMQRLETLLEGLYSQADAIVAPAALIGILADDEIERREETFATAYSAVACPHTGELWYTFGGHPAASHGDWQRLEWPWKE